MTSFTKQAIKASFIKLLNERPMNKISVRDIVEDCGINRNSFYYHYQDIPTLAETIVREHVDELIKEYPSVSSLDEGAEVGFRLVLEHRRAIMNMFNSVNRDVFERSAMALCEHLITAYIDAVFSGGGIGGEDRRVIIRYLKCQLFGLFIDWLITGAGEDAIDDMHRIIELCRDVPETILRRSRGTGGTSGRDTN